MQAWLKIYNWLIKPMETHLKLSQIQTIIYAPEGSYNFQAGRQDFEFEALPFSGVELNQIEKIFHERSKLLGNAFTKKKLWHQKQVVIIFCILLLIRFF